MARKVDPSEVKWFGPIWRRIALTVVMALWCAAEWNGGDQFWAWMTTAVLAYIVWRMFINFPNAAEIAAYEAEQQKLAEAKAAKVAAEQQAADAAEADENKGS